MLPAVTFRCRCCLIRALCFAAFQQWRTCVAVRVRDDEKSLDADKSERRTSRRSRDSRRRRAGRRRIAWQCGRAVLCGRLGYEPWRRTVKPMEEPPAKVLRYGMPRIYLLQYIYPTATTIKPYCIQFGRTEYKDSTAVRLVMAVTLRGATPQSVPASGNHGGNPVVGGGVQCAAIAVR